MPTRAVRSKETDVNENLASGTPPTNSGLQGFGGGGVLTLIDIGLIRNSVSSLFQIEGIFK